MRGETWRHDKDSRVLLHLLELQSTKNVKDWEGIGTGLDQRSGAASRSFSGGRERLAKFWTL